MANDNLHFYFNKVERPPKEKLGNLSGYHSSSDFMDKLSSPEPVPNMPPATTPQKMEAPTGPTSNLFGTMTEGTLIMPPPTTTPTTAPQKPADAFSDYWKTPVVGKMPLDRFVQMAGMISHSLDPDSPMGRMGANLQQMGGLAAAERARREEKESDRQLGLPKEALQTRLLEAQIKKAEIPEEPKRFTDVQKNPTTGVWEFGGREEATGEFKSYREATEAEKESKITGKVDKVEIKDFQIGDRIVPHERNPKTGKWEAIEGMVGTEKEPDQFSLYYKEQKALGKTDTEIVESFKALGKEEEKVTWTTATKQVSNRFGKQDAMGNMFVTPELQGMHRIAQKKLVELKKTGEINPLDAINMAEDFARNVENRYWEYLDAAQASPQGKELTQKVKKQFKTKYGYEPKRRQM